jgi:glucose/arabinose dehydrogenase
MVFYHASAFPERYREGAFVAFHGSHNRAPLRQEGYLVAFVPGTSGGLGSSYEIFANGFAGTSVIQTPSHAAHRPTGVAVDSAGALYISDDKGGRVWRVTFRGRR